MKNLIILPNGTEIFSGNARDNAIISCTYTQCVNDGTELSIGSSCCNELELKLFSTGGLSISAGDEIQYYKVDDSGERTKIGVFRCEKPTITGTGTYKFVAYDNVSKLDKDLTEWLTALDGWPYTVEEFAENVCSACGLSLAVPPTVNANYKIRKFSGSGVTGRMLMQWLGQITCRFIRANADGEIEFAWYTDKEAEIATKGEFAYFGGGLSYEDYQVAEIEKVQIQVSDSDNGTVYPDGNEEELNTYKITGNYLLTAETGNELKPVAQAIFEQLQGVAYTPCKVSIQATVAINAGDIVHITDRNGVRITAYVMSKTNKGQKDTLECTGSYKRDSSTATNDISLKALNGKMLNISKSVDGLRIENADTAGKVADLELNVDGIATRVENAEGDISKIEQTAGEVHVTAQKKKILGAAYSFDTDADGNLVVTYEGDQPGYSINEDGELVLEYEGDTPPDTWIDENGVLHSADDSAMITEHIGTLTSIIDADGTWNMEFEQDDEVVSSIRFDLATRKFVFDGDIVVGDNLKGDITKITNETLETTNVIAKYLQLSGSININNRFIVDSEGNVTLPDNASITWSQVDNKPTNLATTDYVASQGYQTASQVTTITNDTIATTTVTAKNLKVKAANIDGTLTIGQVPSNVATTEYVTDRGYQTSSQVESAITSKGYQTADQVTTITRNTVTTSYVNALKVKAGSVDAENITGTTITGKVLSGVTGDFSGTVTATHLKAVSGGNIAGWTIDDNSMMNGSLGAENSMWLCNTGTKTSASIGTGSGDGWCIAVGNQFGVKKTGVLYASNADLSGKITAASGNIAGFTLGSDDNVTYMKSIKSGYGLALYPAGIPLGNNGYTFFVVIYSNGGAQPVGGLTASGWKTIS